MGRWMTRWTDGEAGENEAPLLTEELILRVCFHIHLLKPKVILCKCLLMPPIGAGMSWCVWFWYLPLFLLKLERAQQETILCCEARKKHRDQLVEDFAMLYLDIISSGSETSEC